MIVEKPAWLHHGKDKSPIYSVDVQPGGLRCATAGSDSKVRIWSTKPLSKDTEADLEPNKLLATLSDHYGSVNCVRWAKSGNYIASGADDSLILIHDKRPGTGSVEFGSVEPPNVENWKVLSTLRGHTADVVDLAWSPDDSLLATCSLDTTVRIWQMPGLPTGSPVAVLTAHQSLVKGIAWDPIGSFLASQSDDKTVIIWQTSDWSMVHRAEGPWQKSVGVFFFRRLAWSPCGHFVITTHGFQKPKHTAQVLERGDWSPSFNFIGHNAPVVVVRFSHSMFRRQPLSSADDNNMEKKMSKDQTPYNVIAIGSQDCNVTVWTTANPRPVFVGKHFFDQSISDLAWSPDGYSLYCSSLDGSVATFQFETRELGYILSHHEMEEIRRERYGDLGQGSLAESPAQLAIEAAAAKQSRKAVPAIKNDATGNVAAPSISSSVKVAANDKPETAKVPAAVPSVVVAPVKQREYLQQDGRRRIIPEAISVNEGDENGIDLQTVKGKRQQVENGEKRKLPAAFNKGDPPVKRLANGVNSVGSANAVNDVTLTASRCVPTVDVTVKSHDGVLSVKVRGDSADPAVPICLEAKPGRDSSETQIVCSVGGEEKWRDRLNGKVTAMTGNSNLWAVGCDDGAIQVYTKAGRRAFPSMLLGSAAAFMDCHGEWELLVLTKGGTIHVWDLLQSNCVLSETLLPLIYSSSSSSAKDNSVMKITSARFSQSGAPLIVLSNGHAFLFHMKMRTWMRIADDTFPASSFATTWPLCQSNDGELASLQKGAAIKTSFKWSKPISDEKYQTRAHLEDQMAASVALKSDSEYRKHLAAYTRFLAREADEVRLRELCEDFLGPDTVVGSSSEPHIIGMKKRELLKTEILPAMASNRSVQRLLNEFLDLLSEYETSTIATTTTAPSVTVTATAQASPQ